MLACMGTGDEGLPTTNELMSECESECPLSYRVKEG